MNSTGPERVGHNEICPPKWAPLVLVLAVVALSAVVMGFRVSAVIRHGDSYKTTPAEGPTIYAVWKVHNGHPVYEWPNRAYYNVCFYNYLFYNVYAYFTQALGATEGRMIVVGRFLTLGFALVGAVATWNLMMSQVGREGSRVALPGVFFAAVAFIVWFGATTMGWWFLSIRPDVAAVAIATLGLTAYLRGLRQGSLRNFAAASVLFFLAWSFKQSVVFILTGVSLHSLVHGRSWKRLLTLTLPCALLMAVSLAALGPACRFNIISIARAGRLLPLQMLRLAGSLTAINLFLFSFVLDLVLRFWPQAGAGGADVHPERDLDLRPLLFPATVATLWGFFSSGHEGAAKNYLLEAIVCSSIISAVLFVRGPLAASPRTTRRLETLKLALLLPMAVYPLTTLLMAVFPALPARMPVLYVAGRLDVATDDQYAARASLAQSIRQWPKPLFIREDILSQPWFSSELISAQVWYTAHDRWPALVMDMGAYPVMQRDGLIEDGGVQKLIEVHHFQTLLLAPDDEFYPIALKAGYQPLPVPSSCRADQPDLERLGLPVRPENPRGGP